MTDNGYVARSYLEALSITRFGGRTYGQEAVVSVPTTRIVLLPNNANRVLWQAINEGGNDVRISIDTAIGASSGWLLAANGGVIISDQFNDGEVVGYAVYAIANAVASNVRIKEVIRE